MYQQKPGRMNRAGPVQSQFKKFRRRVPGIIGHAGEEPDFNRTIKRGFIRLFRPEYPFLGYGIHERVQERLSVGAICNAILEGVDIHHAD